MNWYPKTKSDLIRKGEISSELFTFERDFYDCMYAWEKGNGWEVVSYGKAWDFATAEEAWQKYKELVYNKKNLFCALVILESEGKLSLDRFRLDVEYIEIMRPIVIKKQQELFKSKRLAT